MKPQYFELLKTSYLYHTYLYDHRIILYFNCLFQLI